MVTCVCGCDAGAANAVAHSISGRCCRVDWFNDVLSVVGSDGDLSDAKRAVCAWQGFGTVDALTTVNILHLAFSGRAARVQRVIAWVDGKRPESCDRIEGFDVSVAFLDGPQNIPAEVRVERDWLVRVAVVDWNGDVNRMGNWQWNQHLLASIYVELFPFPRFPLICHIIGGARSGRSSHSHTKCL